MNGLPLTFFSVILSNEDAIKKSLRCVLKFFRDVNVSFLSSFFYKY